MTRRPIFTGRKPSWPPRHGPSCKAAWAFVPRRLVPRKRLL